jgi:hypothetical protein
MGFLRDSAVDAGMIERSDQRFRQGPEVRLHQQLKGSPFTSHRFAGRLVALLGSGPVDPTKYCPAQDESIIFGMRRLQAKKMRSVRAPTSHLPDVMLWVCPLDV